jgi:hypothetical protein
MRHLLYSIVFIVLALGFSAAADDGTSEGAVPNPATHDPAGDIVRLGPNRYLLSPIESVSISDEFTWTDNRHRAYTDQTGWHANGFLLFDVSGIPDGETIVSLSLRCYLEDAFGSPRNNPTVDVYYSGDDDWTRDTALPGSLSLDTLLLGGVLFTSFIEYYDFPLDAAAHDWSVDLADNRICIGFTNVVPDYSYVYFYGAYGDPMGIHPGLTIETTGGGTAAESETWSAIKALFR